MDITNTVTVEDPRESKSRRNPLCYVYKYLQGSGSEFAYVNFLIKNPIPLKLIQNGILNCLALTSTSSLSQKLLKVVSIIYFQLCKKKKQTSKQKNFSINNQCFSGKILPLYLLVENTLIFLKSICVWNCSFCEFLFLHYFHFSCIA